MILIIEKSLFVFKLIISHIENKLLLFILLVTLLTRLYHITFPVIGWHAWRQADTASIARNFYQEESNIFYPRIDWRGDSEGYVESEFQIYTFLVSYLYKFFGFNEFWGRLISVIFSILTVFGIYLLVQRIMNKSIALWSAFIYAILPLNIYFGRAFMPEGTMIMCSTYGIYFFTKWVQSNNMKDYFLSAFFITFASLVKLPALYLGIPLMYLCVKKYGTSFIRKWRIWLFVFIIFIPVIAWYYHAHLLHLRTGLSFNIWNVGVDKWGMIEPLFTIKFYNDIFFKNIAERHLTYGAFIIFIWGLFIKREKNLERLFDWWLVGIIIFIVVAPQAHLAQEYYQLPISIPASVFISKVLNKYIKLSELKNIFRKNKFVVTFLLLCVLSIFVLCFLRIQNFMKFENINAPIFKLAEDVKLNSGQEEKFITVTDGNPAMLYIINRKGWILYIDQLSDEFINDKSGKGAKFITGEKAIIKTDTQKKAFEKLKKENDVILDNADYFLIRIN